MNPARVPVIVGVGQINDRLADPADGMEPLALMAVALRAAEEDAGGGWLERLDDLAVVDQISFRHSNPLADRLAVAVGASPARGFQTPIPSGDSPVRLLNEAANRIGAGESIVAAIAGGEALRTAAARARAAGREQNAARAASTRAVPNYRQRHGLTAPVDVYPLYENAGRPAYGQTLAEGQAETAAIWSGLSDVAVANESAWLRRPVDSAAILDTNADNRPIAFPYTKLTVANSSVNQGAAFIVTSLAEARARGIDESRLVFVGLGAAAHEPDDILARDRFDRSASMEVSIERTLALNGVTPQAIEHVELYSCFPCVPKMARRVLDWPVDRPMTVFGGLTFGGGPIGNYMSHAVAEMVHRLRGTDAKGLLFANGGFATHNHTILLAGRAIDAAAFPQNFDFQAEADARRGPVPTLDEDYRGPATIETYTVFYDRDGAARSGVVVARTSQGVRTLARVAGEDAATIAFLTDGAREPVGASGTIEGEERHWQRSEVS